MKVELGKLNIKDPEAHRLAREAGVAPSGDPFADLFDDATGLPREDTPSPAFPPEAHA
jgi:hypothetical protein